MRVGVLSICVFDPVGFVTGACTFITAVALTCLIQETAPWNEHCLPMLQRRKEIVCDNGPIPGRYVYIIMPGKAKILTLCEVPPMLPLSCLRTSGTVPCTVTQAFCTNGDGTALLLATASQQCSPLDWNTNTKRNVMLCTTPCQQRM